VFNGLVHIGNLINTFQFFHHFSLFSQPINDSFVVGLHCVVCELTLFVCECVQPLATGPGHCSEECGPEGEGEVGDDEDDDK
jgi:hypothetical protein